MKRRTRDKRPDVETEFDFSRGGIKATTHRGVEFGRKVKLTPEQIDHARS
jgi:hypothetical protein